MDGNLYRIVGGLAVAIIGASSASADDYFQYLDGRPETILSHAYQTQAEINADINATQVANRMNPPVYDSAVGGARWTIPAGTASIAIQDQLRPSFPTVSTGNILIVWEARWDSNFANDLGALETHKAFQVSNSDTGDERRLEIRARYGLAPGGGVAQVDARGYIWSPEGQPLAGQSGNFTIEPNTWTRFWVYLDFSGRRMSMWVADDDTQPVRLFNQMQYTNMSGGVDSFWFEFNSSQERSGGAALNVWSRNFAVLKNVSDPAAIVAQGEPQPEVKPGPPTGLRTN